VTEAVTVAVDRLYSWTVNVPDGVAVTVANLATRPLTNIAPGVTPGNPTCEVDIFIELLTVSCNDVVSATPHVAADVKLPDDIDTKFAILSYKS